MASFKPPHQVPCPLPSKMKSVTLHTHLSDELLKAANRLCAAWNPTQVEDAVVSIEFFLGKIKICNSNALVINEKNPT